MHSGTNRGWSLYGPPTHNKVRYYAIADCICRNNMVIEEWLVRDELALVHQLGLEPVQTARDMARREAQANPSGQPDGDIERGAGQLPPPVMAPPPDGSFDPEDFARRARHEIWNWRLLNKVREFYAEPLHAEGPSLRRINGHNDYQGFVLALLAPFPDLAVTIERNTRCGSAAAGWRVALRLLQGRDAFLECFLHPLYHAFPDWQRRPCLFPGGEFEDNFWVASMGDAIGSFVNDWQLSDDLCISPTGFSLRTR